MRQILVLLGELTDEDVDWLTVAGSRETYTPGHVLIEEGKQPDSLFILIDGEVRISISRPTPRDVAVCGPGEFLGELSFLESRPASATVRALSPLIVLRIRRAAMLARLASDRGFAARFYRALAVFLARRLRQRTGSGSAEEDELSPELLDRISMAGKRADWIRSRLLGQ